MKLLLAILALILLSTPCAASTFSTHLSTGMIIGDNIDDPTTAFMLGLISHPILDSIDKEYYIADVWESQDLIGVEIVLSGVQIYRVFSEPDAEKRKTLKWALLGATLFDLIDAVRYLDGNDPLFPWHYGDGGEINGKGETIRNASLVFAVTFVF